MAKLSDFFCRASKRDRVSVEPANGKAPLRFLLCFEEKSWKPRAREWLSSARFSACSEDIRSLALTRKRRESSCLFGWVSLANTLLQIIYRNVTNKKESKYQMRLSGVQWIEQKIINWSVRIHEPETQSDLTDELWQKSYAIFLQMLISEMVVPIS
jgi:hypothetical protein